MSAVMRTTSSSVRVRRASAATLRMSSVVSCTPARDDQEVVVVFDGAGIKKLLLSLAQLKRVD